MSTRPKAPAHGDLTPRAQALPAHHAEGPSPQPRGREGQADSCRDEGPQEKRQEPSSSRAALRSVQAGLQGAGLPLNHRESPTAPRPRARPAPQEPPPLSCGRPAWPSHVTSRHPHPPSSSALHTHIRGPRGDSYMLLPHSTPSTKHPHPTQTTEHTRMQHTHVHACLTALQESY